MPSDEKPSKPLPSAEEIAAYLELSAARTKKRLSIARMDVKDAPKPAPRAPRKLPVSSRAKAFISDPTPETSTPSGDGDAAGSPAWQPPREDDGE